MTDVYIFFVYYIVIKFMYYLSDFEAVDDSMCIKIVYIFNITEKKKKKFYDINF